MSKLYQVLGKVTRPGLAFICVASLSIGCPPPSNTPPTATEAGTTLLAAFDTADMDDDNQLTFAEASAEITNLTQAVFDELDADSDGFLIQSELEAGGEGEGEGEGEGTGCVMVKSRIQHYVGDSFLLGLSLVVLLGSTISRSKE